MTPLIDLKSNQLPKFHLHPLQWFLISILVLTMVNNLDHLAHTYYSLIQKNEGYAADWIRWTISYSVVLVFDMATLAFVLIGSRTESMVSALVILFVNLIFFNFISVGNELIKEAFTVTGISKKGIKGINSFFSIIIFSGTFAYTIHRFSVVFHEKSNGFRFLLGLKTQLKKYETTIKELSLAHESAIKANETTINELSVKYDTLVKASQMALQQKEEQLKELEENNRYKSAEIEHLKGSLDELNSDYNKQTDDLLEAKISLFRNKDRTITYQERKKLAEQINNKSRQMKMLEKIELDFKKCGKV